VRRRAQLIIIFMLRLKALLSVAVIIVLQASSAADGGFTATTGMLELEAGTSELCAGGPLAVFGDPRDQTLMVGPQITFALGSAGAEEKSESSCRQSTVPQVSRRELRQVTTVSECPPELKHLEGRVEETLTVDGPRLTYRRRAPGAADVVCVLRRGGPDAK
jgi:hypothetical protein